MEGNKTYIILLMEGNKHYDDEDECVENEDPILER